MQGVVLEVSVSSIGSETDADHLTNDTVLTMVDVDMFDEENGGSVLINDVEYQYTSVDVDNLTITLSSGITEDLDEGQEVLVSPISREKWALVETEEIDDPVSALVPQDFWDRLSDGVRDEEDQEPVTIETIEGDWVITNVQAKEPEIDGAFLSQDTIDETKISDDAIQTPHLAANAITSKHTITGALIRTAASGKRWELDSVDQNQLRGYSDHAQETVSGRLAIDVSSYGDPFAMLQSPQVGSGGAISWLAAKAVYDTSTGISEGVVQMDGDRIFFSLGGDPSEHVPAFEVKSDGDTWVNGDLWVAGTRIDVSNGLGYMVEGTSGGLPAFVVQGTVKSFFGNQPGSGVDSTFRGQQVTISGGSGVTIFGNGSPILLSTGGSDIDISTGTNGRFRYTDYPSTSNGANVWMASGGQFFRVSSSLRNKDNVRLLAPTDAYVDGLLALEPKRFNSLLDGDDPAKDYVGFIAEDAEALGLTEWVDYDEEGRVQSFHYTAWTPALQAICRRQQEEINSLNVAVSDLVARIEALESGS